MSSTRISSRLRVDNRPTTVDELRAKALASISGKNGALSKSASKAEVNSSVRWAAKEGRQDILQKLIGLRPDVDEADENGMNALLLGAFGGNELVVRVLISAGAVLNSTHAATKMTALMTAAAKGNHGCIQELLQARADATRRDVEGRTALYHAAMNGKVRCVQMLMDGIDIVDVNGVTPLMVSALNIQDQCVRALLTMGANPELKDSQGRTALLMAVEKNHYRCVSVLVDGGKSSQVLDQKDQNSRTPVSVCCTIGNSEILELLLLARASTESRDFDQQTPLMLAAANGHSNCFSRLLEARADYDAVDAFQNSVLHKACEASSEPCVEMLLNGSVDINARDGNGYTSLMICAALGKSNLVSLLVNANADQSPLDENSRTALIRAAMQGYTDCVSLLANAPRAPLNVVDINKRTALMWAARLGKTGCVQELLAAGASVQLLDDCCETALLQAVKAGHSDCGAALAIPDSCIDNLDLNGETALMIAAKKGLVECLDGLINAKANLNVQDGNGKTAVFIALLNRHIECMAKIALAGANLDLQDSDGETVLMMAARRGESDFIVTLAEVKANLDTVDYKGDAAMHISAAKGFVECVTQLELFGANKDLRDRSGNSPLFVAAQNGHANVVRRLLASGASISAAAILDRSGYSMEVQQALDAASFFAKELGQNGEPSLVMACMWRFDDILERRLTTVSLDAGATSSVANHCMHALVSVPDVGINDHEWVQKFMFNPQLTMRIGVDPMGTFVPESSVGTLMTLSHPANVMLLYGNPIQNCMDAISGLNDFMRTKDTNRIHSAMLKQRRSEVIELGTTLLQACTTEEEAVELLEDSFIMPQLHFEATTLEALVRMSMKKIVSAPLAQLRANDIWVTGPVSPRTLFAVRTFFFFFFLGLTAASALLPYNATHPARMLLLLFIAGLLQEKIRQFSESFGGFELVIFLRDVWNITDLVMITSLAIGHIAPIVITSEDINYQAMADSFQAMGTVIAVLRTLHVMQLNYTLGPVLLSMGYMLRDMAVVLVIISLFLLGTYLGLSIIWGKHDINQYGILVNLMLVILQQYNIFTDHPQVDPSWRTIIGLIGVGVYALLTVIMLVNLLIAIMNTSYKRILAQSEREWKFLRTELIFKYAKSVDAVMGPLVPVKNTGHRGAKQYVRPRSMIRIILLIPPPFNLCFFPWDMFCSIRDLFKRFGSAHGDVLENIQKRRRSVVSLKKRDQDGMKLYQKAKKKSKPLAYVEEHLKTIQSMTLHQHQHHQHQHQHKHSDDHENPSTDKRGSAEIYASVKHQQQQQQQNRNRNGTCCSNLDMGLDKSFLDFPSDTASLHPAEHLRCIEQALQKLQSEVSELANKLIGQHDQALPPPPPPPLSSTTTRQVAPSSSIRHGSKKIDGIPPPPNGSSPSLKTGNFTGFKEALTLDWC